MRKLINFKRGFPAESLLKYSSEKVLKPSSVEMWDESTAMKILPYIDNLGLKSLRSDLVKYFKMDEWTEDICRHNSISTGTTSSQHKSDSVSSDPLNRVMITHGCSQGIYHLLTHFKKNLQDPICIVEEPSYFVMPSVIQEAGWNVDGVPMEKDGMDLDALEEKIRKYNGKVKAVYTIPVNHNPSGITLSEEKRRRLVSMSRKYDFFIFADEVYQLLSFSDFDKVKPLAYYDEEYDATKQDNTIAKVFSIGSFSKIIGPGIKLGYILAAQGNEGIKEFNREGGLLYSCGGNNPFMSSVIHQSFENGSFKQNLSHIREEYKTRMEVLANTLQKHGSEVFEFTKPNGGYFLWVKVKLNKDNSPTSKDQMEEFIKCCEEEDVLLIRGDQCCISRINYDYIRVCFGWNEVDDIEEGVKRISRVAEKLRK